MIPCMDMPAKKRYLCSRRFWRRALISSLRAAALLGPVGAYVAAGSILLKIPEYIKGLLCSEISPLACCIRNLSWPWLVLHKWSWTWVFVSWEYRGS